LEKSTLSIRLFRAENAKSGLGLKQVFWNPASNKLDVQLSFYVFEYLLGHRGVIPEPEQGL